MNGMTMKQNKKQSKHGTKEFEGGEVGMMSQYKKIISALERAKRESEEYAQDKIIVPFRELNIILELLKEQEELIEAMKRDLDLVRSCKVCGNWTECTPDAPPESEEFKMWRDCGGSCKLNWTWRGI